MTLGLLLDHTVLC